MSVQNKLTKPAAQTKAKNEVVFMANGLQVTLTPETVKNYLVSGDSAKVTTQELVMFINLCKFNGLNPWLKEAYCIKYGNSPATIVPAKDAFLKRAESHESFDGYEAGVIVYNKEENLLTYRRGSMVMDFEELVGGYAEVFRKDRSHPYRVEVSFNEYVGRKSNGEINSQWSGKPATMIRKVALVQALREAFPTALGGMYTAEEHGVDEPVETVVYEQNADIIDMEQPETQPEKTESSGNDVAVEKALFGGGS